MDYNFLVTHKDRLMIWGLGLVLFAAGLSKLLNPSLWTGFEPEIVRNLVPLSSDKIALFSSIFEMFLGLVLFSRRSSVTMSFIAGIWMLSITISVFWKGMITIGIRDMGLSFYAFSVFLNEFQRKDKDFKRIVFF